MLHKYGANNDEEPIDWTKYQYVMTYVSAYSIVITLGKITITKMNTIKVVVVFCSAKFVAYVIRSIVGMNNFSLIIEYGVASYIWH